MWCGEEHGDCGDDGKEREQDQTDAVNDHCGKLPVVVDELILVVVSNLVRDDAQFFKNSR